MNKNKEKFAQELLEKMGVDMARLGDELYVDDLAGIVSDAEDLISRLERMGYEEVELNRADALVTMFDKHLENIERDAEGAVYDEIQNYMMAELLVDEANFDNERTPAAVVRWVRESHNIDPYGNIPLEIFKEESSKDLVALLFSTSQASCAVAWGYDKTTGEYANSKAFGTDFALAYETANPEIIEGLCVRWEKEDVRIALAKNGVEVTSANVADVCRRIANLKDRFSEDGDEVLDQIASEMAQVENN